MNIKNWLIVHNFIDDKEERARADEAFDDPNPEVWDNYWADHAKNYPRPNWWVYLKPNLEWKPFTTGGDEHMRKDYVFSIPFGPSLVIASRKKAWIYDEGHNKFSAVFATDGIGAGGCHTSEEFNGKRGIEVTFSDNGEVIFVDIDTAVLENNHSKES